MFVPAQNKNSLEDLDTTLLRFSNLSKQAEDSPVSRENENTGSLTPPSFAPNLLHVANRFAAVTAVEKNIITYLAGYLVKKTCVKYPYKYCTTLWRDCGIKGQQTSFIDNRQYSDVSEENGRFS